MDRILRGLRIGEDATYSPDATADQEDSAMHTAPPRYEPPADQAAVTPTLQRSGSAAIS